MARRIWENMGTFLLALMLALLVWIVALNEENPLEERTLTQPVPIELVGLPDNMIVAGSVVSRTQVTIRAPRQALERLTTQQLRVTAVITNPQPGPNVVMLEARPINIDSARITAIEPDRITVNLESSEVREVPISLEVTGEPALGYAAEQPVVSAETVTISGPSSAVDSVAVVEARLSIEGLKRDFNSTISLVPVDANGNTVNRVELSPDSTQVTVPIIQRLGYREVAVTVEITGQVSSGYQVTNITVAPNVVTVSSSDPRLVEQMPGFVDTQTVDLSDASDDIIRRVGLQLPEGVIVVGDQTVLVQVNIGAIEYSLRVERTLEVRGLSPGLSAEVSPDRVDLFILGPLAVLDNLTPDDVGVMLDLTALGPGTYQVAPQLDVLPNDLRVESMLPNRVEVVISVSTPTPTATATPRVTATPP